MKSFIDTEISRMAAKYSNDQEKIIIEFLKEKGYRPKATPEYFKALQKRLNKQGKYLLLQIYPTVTLANSDKILQKYHIKISIEDIQEVI